MCFLFPLPFQIDAPVQRTFAIWVASYYHSLRPRLLVPISLAALMAAWNATADIPLTGLQESGLLLGFLSHKAALLLKVVDAVSPKASLLVCVLHSGMYKQKITSLIL